MFSFVFMGSIPLSTTLKFQKIADYQIDTAIFFLFGATFVQQFLFLIYGSYLCTQIGHSLFVPKRVSAQSNMRYVVQNETNY